MPAPVTIAAFYKFTPLPDYADLREPLLTLGQQRGVLGSILLAAEGVNGTISGPDDGVNAILDTLRSDPRLADLTHKVSYAGYPPFERMKVRLKKEIVTLKVPGTDPTMQVGTYVPPEAWNALIQRPDVVLIDTRNEQEIEWGTFEGAIDPRTRSFSELPRFIKDTLDPKKHKQVAMFCTGGIRCEKATSYLLAQGFEAVYHLDGGILRYLETIPEERSLWRGKCYVFDQRRAVDHQLQPHFTDKETARENE